MSESSETQYYDKLLYYLNRTFAINHKSIELYLDLTKQGRKIRFKSIKNIYSTLTQGKADEVIYQKEKSQLVTNHVYSQLYTQRTCWRMMEKLISKIAYYLSNERKLQEIAPNIIKFISFTRIAGDKINNKASFIHFFKEVLDLIIVQNNMLEQKIYQQLIQKGYIYSRDQFYRMNRFQGPNMEFVYSTNQKEETQQQEPKAQLNLEIIGQLNIKRAKRSQSRLADYQLTHKLLKNSSIKNLDSPYILQQSRKSLQSQIQQNEQYDNIEPQLAELEQSAQQDNLDHINRINHNIHQQMERTVEEILNNLDFKTYMDSHHSQNHIDTPRLQKKTTPRQPKVKQILKNLRLKKFKSNKQLIVIDKKEFKLRTQYQKPVAHAANMRKHKNRISIITAISNRMKQKIFQDEHIAQFQDIMMKKLTKICNQSAEGQSFKSTQLTNTLMAKSRLLTQNNGYQTRKKDYQFQRRKYTQKSDDYQQDYQHPNLQKIIHSNTVLAETSQIKSMQKFAFLKQSNDKKRNKLDLKREQKKTSHQNSASELIFMKKDSNLVESSKTFDLRSKEMKQKRFFNNPFGKKLDEFNSAILGITAKKYNKYDQSMTKLFSISQNEPFMLFPQGEKRKSYKKLNTEQSQTTLYTHHRKYQVYNRITRRLV